MAKLPRLSGLRGATPGSRTLTDTQTYTIQNGYGSFPLPKYDHWVIRNIGLSQIMLIGGGWLEDTGYSGWGIEPDKSLELDKSPAFMKSGLVNPYKNGNPQLHFYVIGSDAGHVEIISTKTENYILWNGKEIRV